MRVSAPKQKNSAGVAGMSTRYSSVSAEARQQHAEYQYSGRSQNSQIARGLPV